MFKILANLFDPSHKNIKKVEPLVDSVLEFRKGLEDQSIDQLRLRIDEIKKELQELCSQIPEQYKSSLLPPQKDVTYVENEKKLQQALLAHTKEVYAILAELLRRQTDGKIIPFKVQLIASAILAQGYKLTELKTGEGKTIVFLLTASLYGLTGRGSHVVTVNDYLARIQGEYAGHILSKVGLTVGVVTPQQSYKFILDEEVEKLKGEEAGKKIKEQKIVNFGDCEGLNLLECSKKEAYECSIVYGTNNELGFDYLRDNMIHSPKEIVQKELYFCIVDEADSILIDEARTPLIISAAAEQSNELYMKFAKLVPKLKEEEDYTVDEKSHSVSLTDEGAEKMEKMLGVNNLWQDYKLAHHLENALKAYRLYKKDDEYIIKNGQVLIVDEFTGRVLEGRRYSEGLHQAIEAKEGVSIKRESKTLGTITFQNFFRLYKILSGGSGTILTEAEEFYKIYNLESIVVPTNKPVIRVDHVDRVYKNREVKFQAVVEEVIQLHQKGQPVLIGTASIEDSETVSRLLEKRGIKHEVLNAKFHEKEAKIVANAGRKGAVTVATNMAGRGTDIKLGGKNATKEEFEEVVKLGGLAVIGTQRHDARRIDNQLRGRSGRQGEPGMSRFYVALDDDIMRIQGGEMVQKVMEMTNIPDDMPIEAGIIGRSIEGSQKRMEGMHFDSRKTVVEYDDVVNQQREIFYSRRRRILEEIEKTDEFLKNKDNESKDQSDLEKMFWEKIDNEIENMFLIHIKDEKSQVLDSTKLVDDYLDLAHDGSIKQAFQEVENIKIDDLKEALVSLLASLSREDAKDKMKKIAKNLFEKKMEEFGNDIAQVAKVLVLRSMDELWTEHLDEMAALRDGIGLRGYAQQDPLVEYKNEGFEIFDKFIAKIDSQVARRVLKVQKVISASMMQQEQMRTNENAISDTLTGTREFIKAVKSAVGNKLNNNTNQTLQTQPQKTISNSIVIGRNDKVSVVYSDGTRKDDVKYKKVENDIKSGLCRVV